VKRRLPAHVPDRLLVPQALEGSELELEGHKLVVVNDGRTDTAHSTSLFVPSIALVVAGDAVYNGIHPYLGETDKQSRLEWISALGKLESLEPRTVIAGHKVPGNDDAPGNIGETRKYLQDFDRLAGATTSAQELYDAMLKLYPNRANPGSVWNAANTVKF
jgi:glyoxylase-like metal-dependent hydrolase (beta-lactamase superfamily II)